MRATSSYACAAVQLHERAGWLRDGSRILWTVVAAAAAVAVADSRRTPVSVHRASREGPGTNQHNTAAFLGISCALWDAALGRRTRNVD